MGSSKLWLAWTSGDAAVFDKPNFRPRGIFFRPRAIRAGAAFFKGRRTGQHDIRQLRGLEHGDFRAGNEGGCSTHLFASAALRGITRW
jgi:hypothetical protein